MRPGGLAELSRSRQYSQRSNTAGKGPECWGGSREGWQGSCWVLTAADADTVPAQRTACLALLARACGPAPTGVQDALGCDVKGGGQAAGGVDPVDNALAVRVLVVRGGAVPVVGQRVPVLACRRGGQGAARGRGRLVRERMPGRQPPAQPTAARPAKLSCPPSQRQAASRGAKQSRATTKQVAMLAFWAERSPTANCGVDASM